MNSVAVQELVWWQELVGAEILRKNPKNYFKLKKYFPLSKPKTKSS